MKMILKLGYFQSIDGWICRDYRSSWYVEKHIEKKNVHVWGDFAAFDVDYNQSLPLQIEPDLSGTLIESKDQFYVWCKHLVLLHHHIIVTHFTLS